MDGMGNARISVGELLSWALTTPVQFIVAAPFYMAGFQGGSRLFTIAPQSMFRKVALWLLIATGLTAVVF